MQYQRSRNSSPSSYGRPQQRSGRRPMVHRSFDPSQVVKYATVQPQEEAYVPTHTFTDFGLHPSLVANIMKRYKTPTQIQAEVIPHIMEGKDVIGLANTGTGKTAAFLLPLIHKVATDSTNRVLIVAPTRELAVQIDEELRQFSYNSGIYSVICVHGRELHFFLRTEIHILLPIELWLLLHMFCRHLLSLAESKLAARPFGFFVVWN